MTAEQTLTPQKSSSFSYQLMTKIDSFTERTGSFIAYFSLIMVLLSVLIVVLRYVFNLGWIAMQESVLYLHAMVFMLGAAYTLKADGHVRVDIFYQNMSAKSKAKVNLAGAFFLLIPFSLFIVFICFDYVTQSWQIQEQSPEAGGLAFVYLNKTLLLLMPINLLLQAIADIIRQIHAIKSPCPSSHESTIPEVKI